MALDTSASPQIPPALAALFAQRAMNATQAPGAPNANPAITPPSMTPGPAAPMRNVFGMPQGAGIFQKPASQPTDDPALLQQGALTPEEHLLVGGGGGVAMGQGGAAPSAPALPTAPDFSGVANEQKKISDIESKMSSMHAPTPEEYKPSWWRRLLSIPLATAAGLNNPAAGDQASDTILYGPYHQAQKQYEAQLSPLQRQLMTERDVNLPAVESAARLAQNNFTNQMDLTKERREQTAFENETGDKTFQETDPADGKVHYYQTTKGGIKREVPEPREQAEDRRKREEDANSPAPNARPEPDPTKPGTWRVKTKSGAYIPYTPKSVDEGALLGDKRATQLFREEHPGKEAKDPQDENGYTPGEKREIDQRTRRFNAQIDALNKQRAALSVLPNSPASQKMLKNIDSQLDSLYGQTDAIEKEVMGRRPAKSAGAQAASGGAFKVPAGAPAAKGVPDGHQLKQHGKVIAVAKGGQWVAP